MKQYDLGTNKLGTNEKLHKCNGEVIEIIGMYHIFIWQWYKTKNKVTLLIIHHRVILQLYSEKIKSDLNILITIIILFNFFFPPDVHDLYFS